MVKAGTDVVKTIIEFIIGLACLPLAAAYAVIVNNDPNVSGMTGLSLVITLGVLIIALGLIYHSAMQLFGK